MADEAYVAKLPECDIHKYVLGTPGVPAAFDGKTRQGPWANMCPGCFPVHGIGLGTGKGQRLIVGTRPKPRVTTTMLESLPLDDLQDIIGDGGIADYL